jgi:PAS domain S-box-containing protein
MSLFSSLNFFGFIVYLTLVLYILFKNPKPLVNRLCIAFVACLGAWSFVKIFIHNPYISGKTAEIFTDIGSIGWVSFSSFFLWFMLEFTRKRDILKTPYLYVILFALPLILIPLQWGGFLMQNYTKYAYGWRSTWKASAWIYVYFGYCLTFTAAGLFLAFGEMKKSANKTRKKQARIIFFSALISAFAGTVSDFLLPVMDIFAIPNMANLFALIWASGIVYAMARYRLLGLKSVTPDTNIKTTMFDCLILLTAEGNIAAVNDVTLRLSGYRDEELKGQPLHILFEKGMEGTGLMDKILSHENSRNRDLILRAKTGKKIPVTFSSSLLMSEEETVEGIVCVARDISEQKRNEVIKDVLLQISEAALRAVTLRELLEIIQQQVDRLMDARNFYAALVYDRERALYTFPFIVDINPEEIEDPDTPVELKRSFTDYVMRMEKPMLADKRKYDELFVREDIQLIGKKPMSWLGVPLKTPEDGVIGVVVIQSYIDESAYSQSDLYVLSIISNTIAGAVKYKQAEEALRQSEEHYRTLIDNIQDGVFLLYNSRYEFVNDAFARMVGYTPAELIGKDFRLIISPGDLKMVTNRYLRRLQGENVPAEYEFRMVHRNGTDVFVNINVGMVKYKDGTAAMGTLKDITGRVMAEKEKIELEERLARSEKMEAIGRLAGGVAHDLNNVLSAIVSYPDYLLMKLPQDSPLRKSIETMKHSGQRAAAIVQDLLTLARRGVNIKEIISLNHTISDYLSSPEFEKLVKYNPQANVTTQLESDLLNIKGSAIHLSKTVMNLLSNAAEAMPSGGEISIKTENRYIAAPKAGYYQTIEKGDYVVLTVSDTGTGIAPGDLNKIFDPFYTKKEMGRSGTGLGMAVVWGTMEDHKGFIDVASTEGKGTTFTLYFPITWENNLNQDVDISIQEYRGKGEKIMVVDDEPDQREIAAALLEELGYLVYAVASGEEAVEHVKTKTDTTHLLLLDMLMGHGIDGLDTYREVLKYRPGMKAIITSGFSESERVKEALKLGAGMYIKKPYTLKKIGLAVRKELDR